MSGSDRNLTRLTEKILEFVRLRPEVDNLKVMIRSMNMTPLKPLENFLLGANQIKTLFFECGYLIDPNCFQTVERLSLGFAKIMSGPENIRYIDLFIKNFSDVIVNHQHLEFLEIMYLGDNYSDDIIKAVTNNATIKELDLRYNFMSDKHIFESLKELLEKNTTLKTLRLSDCLNSEFIIEGLANNESVTKVDFGKYIYTFRQDNYSKHLGELLDELLETNFNLQEIVYPHEVVHRILDRKIKDKLERNRNFSQNKRFFKIKPLPQTNDL